MVFRGELREELRDQFGDPLNLIRVMPAKGQEFAFDCQHVPE